MEKTLKHLFDFHKFSENVRLAEMIADTESRYGKMSFPMTVLIR